MGKSRCYGTGSQDNGSVHACCGSCVHGCWFKKESGRNDAVGIFQRNHKYNHRSTAVSIRRIRGEIHQLSAWNSLDLLWHLPGVGAVQRA